MNKFNQGRRLLAASALMLAAGLAQAQYVWINAKGSKEFSDQPPPPSVPLKNILKAPPAVPAELVSAPTEAAAPPAEPAARTKAPPTLAERNADYRKRATEQAEREVKAREESEIKAATAASCASARESRQTLDSGARIGIMEKNGERGFMSDGQRALESQKVNKVLAGCK